MKHGITVAVFCLGAIVVKAQNVGIGVASPTQKLEVAGNIKCGNAYVDGFLGINTSSPSYRLHLNDGIMGFTNTSDGITWSQGYNSTSNYFYNAYNSVSRMVITNTGNVGIGTTAPAQKLDVNGSLGASSAAIDGNLTVNGGYGMLRNGHSSTQLKYYTFTGSFTFTNFNGHTVSGPHQVNIPGGADFGSAPRVMVGNYTYISGTEGHLFSIIPAIYSVTSTGFQVYFFNSSANQATMNFTLSFICIGS